jgi:hypothetical protein
MTKAKPKTKSKPSRAVVVRKSKPPAAPTVADEAMRLICETHANSVETLELQREATALARADADSINKKPAAPQGKLDLVDVLLVKEAAYIVHFSDQNIYHNIGYVGFAIGSASYVSNAKLREHWPDRYDEARFWETVRKPINAERFASILEILPRPNTM